MTIPRSANCPIFLCIAILINCGDTFNDLDKKEIGTLIPVKISCPFTNLMLTSSLVKTPFLRLNFNNYLKKCQFSFFTFSRFY